LCTLQATSWPVSSTTCRIGDKRVAYEFAGPCEPSRNSHVEIVEGMMRSSEAMTGILDQELRAGDCSSAAED
jgi:hypothetical protein